MPSLFRRRKVPCFYCGQQSVPGDSAAFHPNGRVSVFTCPLCNADNHLDQVAIPLTSPSFFSTAPLSSSRRPAAPSIADRYA